MNHFIYGLKSALTNIYLNTGKILLTTIILIKVINFYILYKIKKLYSETNNNYYNNFFFHENIKTYFEYNYASSINDLFFESDAFLDKKAWKNFYIGKILTIIGKTIGKGTAGNIKKHNFSRGPVSHGSKHVRLQGSLGSGTTPGRTLPGKRMSGHLGSKFNKTVKSKIILLNPKENFIFVQGSIQGKKNNLLLLS